MEITGKERQARKQTELSLGSVKRRPIANIESCEFSQDDVGKSLALDNWSPEESLSGTMGVIPSLLRRCAVCLMLRLRQLVGDKNIGTPRRMSAPSAQNILIINILLDNFYLKTFII